ncbi:MAG: Fur family transcriptional regulator [Nocardioidaceae bacterium]
MTRCRDDIVDLLEGAGTFLTAQDIHAQLRSGGRRAGLATVYRNLQGLAAGGDLDTLLSPSGEASYRLCSSGHHHHLVCRTCGRTIEVEGPAVERWARRVASEHGFAEVSHTLEIFGTCADCAPRTARAPRTES